MGYEANVGVLRHTHLVEGIPDAGVGLVQLARFENSAVGYDDYDAKVVIAVHAPGRRHHNGVKGDFPGKAFLQVGLDHIRNQSQAFLGFCHKSRLLPPARFRSAGRRALCFRV